MRYLNKIVFINSAHIPYTEIQLDGNVHFIGTQGVGKSTLLRALLFFYNANKMKLGIQREQRGFDDFYLPSPDSYIIYEVARENGNFMVVAFRNQGRAAFRFIDCAYDRSIFIDQSGNVMYEWSKIHQRIGRHFYSNIIRNYPQYLDIIYGNKQNVQGELRRMSIMESQRYQNIPRTIQNIFLNQSLESRVIKDIIIDSMDFNDGAINLNFYRDKVKDFEQQYTDIGKWYKKEKNGRVKVVDDADRVISSHTAYQAARKLVEETSGEMAYAYERDKALLPQKELEADTEAGNLKRQRELLAQEADKHTKERDTLKNEEAVVKSRLDTIKQKRTHYEEIDIEAICQRVAQRDVVQTNLRSIDHQIAVITDKNRSVKEKYELLAQQEKQKMAELENQAATKRNQTTRHSLQLIGELQEQAAEQRDERQSFHQARIDQLAEKEQEVKADRQQQDLERLRIRQANPHREEMDEIDRKMAQSRSEETECRLKAQQKQKEIAEITAQAELREQQMLSQFAIAEAKMLQQIGQSEEKAAALQQLLQQQHGSLIEWLEGHVDGWQHSLGKVLDEEAVLYNTALEPQKVDGAADTVFGIRLNLDNIDRTVRTPADMLREKQAADRTTETLKADLTAKRKQLETDIEAVKDKFGKQLKALRQQRSEIETTLRIIPGRLETLQRQRGELEARLNRWREEQLAETDKRLAMANQALAQMARQRSEMERQRKADLDKLKKAMDSERKKIEAQTKAQLDDIDTLLTKQRADHTLQLKRLEAQMDAELKGSGIDTSELERLRAAREAIAKELLYIENHQQDFYSWQKDNEEYFAHENEWKDRRRMLQQKIADLEDRFAVRRKRYQDHIAQAEASLNRLNGQITEMKRAIDEVDAFRLTSSYAFASTSATPTETVKPLAQIYSSLRNAIADTLQQMEQMKQAVGTFKTNFTPQNTFHFNLELNTEADYTDFAIQLDDFVSNKKIEEYRSRTSKIYTDILKRIAHEVNDLMAYKGRIEQTIHDINRDFKENNFAGVIKNIELRSEESNDRLMQHLLTIRRFVDEADADLGELNLFSSIEAAQKNNERSVDLLISLVDLLAIEQKRDSLCLADTFKLEFKVRENDNDTGWVEKLSNVGSDGTDILVKAMVNIMLINVFKHKVSRRFGDFKLHCLMDEIGKLHPNNVKGILDFANKRNIYLINSSPTAYSAMAYRYTYALSKDSHSNTVVRALLAIK